MRADRSRLAAAVAFAAAAIAVTVYWHEVGGDREVVDIARYRELGEAIASGAVPYRDVALEYPPGAILAVLPPALVVDGYLPYYAVFAALMALAGAIGVFALGRLLAALGHGPGSERARLLAVALAPLPLGGVILTRFDLLPAVVLLGALSLLLRGRERAGFLALGVAIAIKLYALALLPVALAWTARRSGRQTALRRAAEALAPAALAYAAFAALSPGGVADSLWWQLSRPLQIESLGAGVLLALHQAAGFGLSWSSGSGSQNLDGTAAGVLAALTSLAGAAALAAIWVAFARGEPSLGRLVRFSAAAVVAFVAFSKVLSPQFLVWLLFLVPLVVEPWGGRALALLGAACLLTGIWFPGRYWSLVREFDTLASWLVLPRGLLLAGALAALLLTSSHGDSRARSSVGRRLTGRARAAARSPSLDPSPDRT